MAIATFDIDSDTLKQYLANYRMSQNATGGSPSSWIDLAASEVATELRNQGLTPSAITSADYPEAYQVVKNAIALLACAYWVGAFTLFQEDGKPHPLALKANKAMKNLRTPGYIGEIRATGTYAKGLLLHRDKTDTQMRDERTSWKDDL